MRTAPFIKTALAAAMLASLGACATPFRADVSRFSAMPAPSGQSYAIAPRDDADKGGLEFGQYASLVSAEMTRLGYRAAAPGEAPDFTVTMHYGVDEGRERIVRSPGFHDPFWGSGWGGFYGRGHYGRPVIIRTRSGYRYVHGGYDPFLFGSGWGDYGDIRSYTVYTSGLDVVIARTGTGEHLFEGSAEAASRSNDLTQTVPGLVEALFTGFPGNSGEKVRITIAPPEGRQR